MSDTPATGQTGAPQGGDGGEGTTPPAGTDQGQQQGQEQTTPDPAALAAEVEKWKAAARKHESRAKANADAARRVQELERSQMTEQDRIVAEVADRTRAEVRAEYGARLVDAEIRAAATGRPVNVDALLKRLDRSEFLTDDGNVDGAAIAAWLDELAPAKGGTPPPRDFGQGAGRGELPLNGDPIEQALRAALGI